MSEDPTIGSVGLHAREAVTRKNQGALVWAVFAEAVVERRSVEERIDVKELRARPNLVVRAIGRQVGLGLIGPQRVEALAQDVVADHLPVPLGGGGVGGVDVRPGAVVGQPVDRRTVRLMNQPAFLMQIVS